MPRSLSFLTFVLGSFHSFHTHILSLLLIHESRFANTLGVSANEKYPHHPMRYWFNFFIRYAIGYGFFREVISRILAFIRFTLSLATLIFGSILNVKLKPRNFLRQGRSTLDLSRLTFSFNLSSINDVTEFMTRKPALRVFTNIWEEVDHWLLPKWSLSQPDVNLSAHPAPVTQL